MSDSAISIAPSDSEYAPVLPHRRLREDDEMDITPMIDITFLLLIYFLVASTQDEQSRVKVPEARYASGVAEQDATTFSVTEGGLELAPVYLGDGAQPENQITGTKQEQADKIQQTVQSAVNEGRNNVVIMAEGGVSHREVARVAGAASRVSGIHLHFGVLTPD